MTDRKRAGRLGQLLLAVWTLLQSTAQSAGEAHPQQEITINTRTITITWGAY